MFVSDLSESNKQEVQNAIVNDLRLLGIKQRLKKFSTKQRKDISTKLFKIPLHLLPLECAVLDCGITTEIPRFVYEMCRFISQHVEIEGLFRKAGSTARQRELRIHLENGKKLGQHNHVIDVANILKWFFRELPEPLIPFTYHEVLLRCLLLKEKKLDGILLICLLFPALHLNTLAYLMVFLQKISMHSDSNKMDATNLAIIITPSIMPVGEKAVQSNARLTHHVQVVELLIRNAEKIGIIPETMMEKLTCQIAPTNDELDSDVSQHSKKHKKKRRSGSLTRMLNGLKKIVGKGTPEIEESTLITSTPDFSTPLVKSAKKRKAMDLSAPFSGKKKKDVLHVLPQGALLGINFCTPRLEFATPVCSHPNPGLKSKSPSERKLQHRKFFARTHSDSIAARNNKQTQDNSIKKQKYAEEDDSVQVPEVTSQTSFEQRWSAEPWCTKKRLNLSDILIKSPSTSNIKVLEKLSLAENISFMNEANVNLSDTEVDVSQPSDTHLADSEFVRISKSEYESIKSRVSAIESRISEEFNNIVSAKENGSRYLPSLEFPSIADINSNTELVQTAYERTLEESEKLEDPATDQLAKRLSKELKIRSSQEHKVIRSPSARKIGTFRRRSKESAKPLLKKSPNGQEFVRNIIVGNSPRFCPRSTLRRGRPNTVFSGLPNRKIDHSISTNMQYHHLQHTSHDASDMSCSLTNTPSSNCSYMLAHSCSNATPVGSLIPDAPFTRSRTRRASSFHEHQISTKAANARESHKDLRKTYSHSDLSDIQPYLSVNENNSIKEHSTPKQPTWQSADVFFTSKGTNQVPAASKRASIAKLRSQNAGIVMERMKLFDAKAHSALLNKCKRTNARVQNETTTDSLKGTPVCSALVVKSHVANVREEVSRDSPKKIGSPRRKTNVSKSASCDHFKSQVKGPMATNSPNRRVKKYNSVKPAIVAAAQISSKTSCFAPVNWTPVKGKENMISPANGRGETMATNSPNRRVKKYNSVKPAIVAAAQISYQTSCFAPVNWTQIKGKENMISPANGRGECSPQQQKHLSPSPLKDSNRNDTASPYRTPYIKKPLLTKSAGHFSATPQSGLLSATRNRHINTPMKALIDFSAIIKSSTTPQRQSPRLQLLKSQNIS